MNEILITLGQVLFALSSPVLYAEDYLGRDIWDIENEIEGRTYGEARKIKQRRGLLIIFGFWGFGTVIIGVGLCV